MTTRSRLRRNHLARARRATLVALPLLLLAATPAAAASPSFTLSPPSPSLPLALATAADILNPAVPPALGPLPPPVLGIPAAALGLGPGDVISGISFGIGPFGPAVGLEVLFSVDGASTGIVFPPPPANLSCEFGAAQGLADVFQSQPFGPPLPFPNVLALDGNGIADACPPPPLPGLGLIEPSPDNLVALELCPASFVFSGAILTAPVYFTLAPASPTLLALPAGATDVLVALPPGFLPPVVAIPGGALALAPCPPGFGAPACDEIDALEVAPGGALALFSLAPGSPSLGLCGFTPADILFAPPPGCPLAVPGAALGLTPVDNVDALAMNFDVDADFVADPCDNCIAVPNNNQADTDGDGVGDVCDPCFGSPNVDGDADGICDANDNCPAAPNPGQGDADGDGSGDACDPTYNCPAASTLGCDSAGKSILIIKDKGMDGATASDKLVWKWLKGPTTLQTDFGDPTATASYAFCVYDGTGALAVEVNVPAGGANWSSIGTKGYKYLDPTFAADGTQKLLLKGSTTPGKSKLLLKGRDGNLPIVITTLPLDTSADIVTQLHNSDNANCWTASFAPATVIKNTDALLKAKEP